MTATTSAVAFEDLVESDTDLRLDERVLRWFNINDCPEGRSQPEVAAGFADTSSSMQPRVVVLEAIGCLERVANKPNPLTGNMVKSYRPTGKPYCPEAVRDYYKTRNHHPFTLGAFERYFNGLSDELAAILLDRINEIVRCRWPDAS